MKQKKPATGAGALSVVTVLLILTFTMFAILAQSSASAEQRLSQKTADATTAYYQADAAGQALLARLAALPELTAQTALAAAEPDYAPTVTETPDGPTLSCTIPGAENHVLEVQIRLEKPLTVLVWRWNTIPEESPTENATLPVWQGEEN